MYSTLCTTTPNIKQWESGSIKGLKSMNTGTPVGFSRWSKTPADILYNLYTILYTINLLNCNLKRKKIAIVKLKMR